MAPFEDAASGLIVPELVGNSPMLKVDPFRLAMYFMNGDAVPLNRRIRRATFTGAPDVLPQRTNSIGRPVPPGEMLESVPPTVAAPGSTPPAVVTSCASMSVVTPPSG